METRQTLLSSRKVSKLQPELNLPAIRSGSPSAVPARPSRFPCPNSSKNVSGVMWEKLIARRNSSSLSVCSRISTGLCRDKSRPQHSQMELVQMSPLKRDLAFSRHRMMFVDNEPPAFSLLKPHREPKPEVGSFAVIDIATGPNSGREGNVLSCCHFNLFEVKREGP